MAAGSDGVNSAMESKKEFNSGCELGGGIQVERLENLEGTRFMLDLPRKNTLMLMFLLIWLTISDKGKVGERDKGTNFKPRVSKERVSLSNRMEDKFVMASPFIRSFKILKRYLRRVLLAEGYDMMVL